ncbi:MAG: glycoside hydrolase family 16 protein [Novosphingobium sp.]
MKTLALIGTLLLSASAAAPDVRGNPIDLCDFSLTFEDSFDDMSISAWELNGKRWMAHTPWRGDFGDAAFADPGPGGPFSLRDGALQITASRDKTGRWRSGLIAAADASGQGVGTQYGYFEARMRFPPGPGTWPAFWLISLKPVSDKSPKIEIDAVEYYGHDDSSYQVAWHVWFEGKDQDKLNRGGGAKVSVPAGSLIDRYHDYGVRVEPDWTTFYLDRKSVARVPTPRELKTPLYPLVNLALGSGYPIDKTPDPSVLLVEYVRVYRDDPAGRSARCPAKPQARTDRSSGN